MFFLLLACAYTTTALPPRPTAADVPGLPAEAWPFTPRHLAVAGGELHYVDEGEGSPVVFVHGTPSWSWEWRHAIAALRGEHRVIAPDLLGFGLSAKPVDADYTPEAQAGRLAELLDPLDLHGATVVVHDFGGPVGLDWVLDHPDRVAHVVIVNTWMWSLAEDRRAVRLSRLVAGPVGRYLYLQRNLSPRRLIPWSLGEGTEADAAFLAPYVNVFPSPEERHAPWRYGVELAGSSAFYDGLWQRREALRGLDVTVVWGMADPTFGPDSLARWREALPAARVVELPGVGHFPQEEAPEAFLGALRAAMGANSAGGPASSGGAAPVGGAPS